MKKIIVLALFGTMFIAANAQQPQRFGYLNTQELITQMPDYAEVNRHFRLFRNYLACTVFDEIFLHFIANFFSKFGLTVSSGCPFHNL